MHFPHLLACGGGWTPITWDVSFPKWEGDTTWYEWLIRGLTAVEALVALAVASAVVLLVWRWLSRASLPAPFAAVELPELEGAEAGLRLAYGEYRSLAHALAAQSLSGAPAALARADASVASTTARLQRALPRLPPAQASAVRRMVDSVERMRALLVRRAEHAARRLFGATQAGSAGRTLERLEASSGPREPPATLTFEENQRRARHLGGAPSHSRRR